MVMPYTTSGSLARGPLTMVLDYEPYQFLEDKARLAV